MGGDSVISVQGSSFVAGTGISISGETISTTITQYADSDVQSYLNNLVGRCNTYLVLVSLVLDRP